MTFEETKKLLKEMKLAKIRAKNLRRDLEEIQRDIAALTLQSSLGRSNLGHSTDVHSSVESAVLRLEKKRKNLRNGRQVIRCYPTLACGRTRDNHRQLYAPKI